MSNPNITEASTPPKKSRRTVAADTGSNRAAPRNPARPARQLQLVQEINQILASDTRIEQALQQALRLILGELAYGAAQIYRLSPFGKDLWLYLDVTARDEMVAGQSVAIFSIEEDNLLCQAVRDQKPVYLPHVRQDSQSYPVRTDTQGEKTETPRLRVASELAVPVAFGPKMVGALRVQSDQPDDFKPEDTNFFTIVASLLGIKVELSQTVQQLQDELQ
jgi:GAF domain-containing protein